MLDGGFDVLLPQNSFYFVVWVEIRSFQELVEWNFIYTLR